MFTHNKHFTCGVKESSSWTKLSFEDVILIYSISEAAYVLAENWDGTVFCGNKNWQTAQRLVCHYGLFNQTVCLNKVISFSETSDTIYDDLRMLYRCRRPKFTPRTLLCGISIWLRETYSSAAHRVNFCVSTAKWLRERTATLQVHCLSCLIYRQHKLRSGKSIQQRWKNPAQRKRCGTVSPLGDVRTTQHLFILICRRYTTRKTVVILQLVKLGCMFRPLPGHHQANKEILLIKVHSLALSVYLN